MLCPQLIEYLCTKYLLIVWPKAGFLCLWPVFSCPSSSGICRSSQGHSLLLTTSACYITLQGINTNPITFSPISWQRIVVHCSQSHSWLSKVSQPSALNHHALTEKVPRLQGMGLELAEKSREDSLLIKCLFPIPWISGSLLCLPPGSVTNKGNENGVTLRLNNRAFATTHEKILFFDRDWPSLHCLPFFIPFQEVSKRTKSTVSKRNSFNILPLPGQRRWKSKRKAFKCSSSQMCWSSQLSLCWSPQFSGISKERASPAGGLMWVYAATGNHSNPQSPLQWTGDTFASS